MGHFYESLHTSGKWLKSKGVEDDMAARYVTGIYQTILAEAVNETENGGGVKGFEHLVSI